MNNSFGTIIKETRKQIDINQDTLANVCGISRRYLSDIENDLVIPSDTVRDNIQSSLKRFDNLVPLKTMIDYVKIRFSTLGVKSIVENVLGIKYQYMFLMSVVYIHMTIIISLAILFIQVKILIKVYYLN